ncbi:hypothetical protein K431DRAFT_316250 [Polychaeton citri CBS 116435]|uniref:GDP-mannose transporter n=1 Tax=Polychaeton citri CBS 116435 TaxID=1314669 RepID=A0A9P4UKJ2_9PEZI|nr:hypothetical protein K431DRAFT_316250 [Polychaeton citri CBS 116435]
MHRLQSFASKTSFEPPMSYLTAQKSRSRNDTSDSSQFLSVDDSPPSTRYRDRSGSRGSQHSTQSVSLISLSRESSPLPRQRSAHQSEDEDEAYYASITENDANQSRPLVAKPKRKQADKTLRVLRKGGLGRFLFRTRPGRQTFIGLLSFWMMGTGFGLLLMNRFVLWTGTYKFPYPLTVTLLELLIAHAMMVSFARFTQLARPLLFALGLEMAIAPSEPYQRVRGPQGFRRAQQRITFWAKVRRVIFPGSGGIAGGGLLEFEWRTAKQVIPLAVVFFAKVLLSNISYAYAVLPVYESSRIPIVPFTLISTYLASRTSHSVQTLSSSLIATLNLLMTSIQPGNRAPWQGIVAGVFSTMFVALYPILLQKTYRALVADLSPQSDVTVDLLSDSESDGPTASQRKRTGISEEETRAYYRVLHYTSLLAIIILLPAAAVSGEWRQIKRNCYFLDVPWFWFLIWCSSLACWAVFQASLLFVTLTSPLTANFVMVPRRCFELAVLSRLRMPAHSWVGAALCWLSCIWYTVTRAREGRLRDVMAVEHGG